jgi:hypothetical protein
LARSRIEIEDLHAVSLAIHRHNSIGEDDSEQSRLLIVVGWLRVGAIIIRVGGVIARVGGIIIRVRGTIIRVGRFRVLLFNMEAILNSVGVCLQQAVVWNYLFRRKAPVGVLGPAPVDSGIFA